MHAQVRVTCPYYEDQMLSIASAAADFHRRFIGEGAVSENRHCHQAQTTGRLNSEKNLR
jgi:hypothetical protein